MSMIRFFTTTAAHRLVSLTRKFSSVAIIGGGQVTSGIINHLASLISKQGQSSKVGIKSIDIFDKYTGIGAGMPYDPQSTDLEHLINVTSNSISPDFGYWMKENQSHLMKFVSKFFESRQQEKIGNISNNPSLTEEEKEEKITRVTESYKIITQSFIRRSLDLSPCNSFHPRNFFGLFSMARFQRSCDILSADGIEINLHPETEIIDLEKSEKSTKLTFISPSTNSPALKEFDDVVIATGRWRTATTTDSSRFISDVWPIHEFRKKLAEALGAESKKPKTILIRGSSLSAFDALKTIFRNGFFYNDQDGKLVFNANQRDDQKIKVDMVSRSGLMPRAQGRQCWINHQKENLGENFPQGIEITQKMIDQLASEQNEKIRLWQVMLMTVRALELGYLSEGEHRKANEARDFEKLILANIKKSKVGEKMLSDSQTDNILRNIKGSALSQLKQFQTVFGLELDGANYQRIYTTFKRKFFEDNPIEQLESSLRLAKTGDVPSGYMMSKDVVDQIDNISLVQFLPSEESLFFLQKILRVLNAFTGGNISNTAAEELLAMHRAGVVDIITDQNLQTSHEESDGVVFTSSSGKKTVYHAVVNAMGYDTDISKNNSPMFQSMLRNKYFKIGRELFAENEKVFRSNISDFEERFGKNETKEILSRISLDKDGKYYSSTGDFIRKGYSIVDGRNEQRDCDVLLDGIMIAPFCSISSAALHGRNIAEILVKKSEQQIQYDSNNSRER